MYSIVCRRCRIAISEDLYRIACPCCGGNLAFDYDGAADLHARSGDSMWKYRSRLPLREGVPIISLHEGMTPLEAARDSTDGGALYFKNETRNPTRSHKDRAIPIAISKAVESGFGPVMVY